MNPLTFGEMIGFAKVYSVCLGALSPATVSKQEKELAVDAMKKIRKEKGKVKIAWYRTTFLPGNVLWLD